MKVSWSNIKVGMTMTLNRTRIEILSVDHDNHSITWRFLGESMSMMPWEPTEGSLEEWDIISVPSLEQSLIKYLRETISAE